MRAISNAMETALSKEVTTLATCWKMTRRDGQVAGFTDFDQNIVVDSLTYEAKTGFSPTAIASSANLNVDNLDVEGMLSAESIRAEDVLAGIYDFAEIEIFLVDYTAPAMGRLMLHQGWLGEIALHQGRFVAEVRGLTQKLTQHVTSLYSPSCRATLGDEKCKLVMTSFTHEGTVTSVNNYYNYSDSSMAQADHYFAAGKVSFISGANAGFSMEVKEFKNGEFVLVLPLPYEIAIGDTYTAFAGCNKNFDTCCKRFNNAVNFRGEPHVPGLDRMLETAATKTRW